MNKDEKTNGNILNISINIILKNIENNKDYFQKFNIILK